MKYKEKISQIVIYLGITFTFLILDVGLRYIVHGNIGFVSVKSYSPLAFSLSYILTIIFLMTIFKKRTKLIYTVLTILANIYFFAQIIDFKILGNFFSIMDLLSVKEATDYLSYILKETNDAILIVMLLSINSMIAVLNIMKKTNFKININRKKFIIISLILLVILRVSAIYKLGSKVDDTDWDAWKKPKNVYNNYSNNCYSMMVSGMYEYIFRDGYLYFKRLLLTDKKKEIKDINEYLLTLDNNTYENEYTGIFENKNLIIIMLESIDNWLVTKEIMPTMYNLSQEGLNFTNRYAPFFGSGMTINSEFAGISGLYSLTSDKAIYNYNLNNYDYSLANLFKHKGYSVNSIHMNDGAFYNRKNFHLGLGFEKHYPLYEMGFNENFNYDSNIVKNENSYKLITNKEPFLTFITTYSAHVPYVDNELCNNLSKQNPNLIIKNNQELSCIRLLAHETDDFIKLLIEKLQKDKLLDNTAIVLYSDHYAYGYSKIKEEKKTNDNNLIQKTPFIIWSKNIKGKSIDTITDTADIPVTLFNMFNIKYNPTLYMGTDIFGKNHENFVYFNDYSWYDGKYYSKDEQINDYTKEISKIVNNKININKKIIHSNFYNNYKG